MVLDKFLTEKISLLKSNGELYENIPAGVQTECILVADVSKPIEYGDQIVRLLPSGVKETFVVTDPGYQAGIGPIEAHYQVKYDRSERIQKTESTPQVTYNVSGPNSRVNVNSIDQSTNIDASVVTSTLDQIREALQKEIEDSGERQLLVNKLDELARTHGTDRFAVSYKEFMAMAANHMTVLAPFIPALAALL